MNYRYMQFLVLLVLFGCNVDNELENPVPFDVGDKKIKEELLKKLENENIDYEVIDEVSIKVSKDDVQMVLLYTNRIQHSIVPFDRSTSLTQPYRARFVELLKRNNIQYEAVEVFDTTWIIWQEEDSEEVASLLERIVE